jgi:hypothetical protein
MRELHDLRADWRRWSRTERIMSLLTLASIVIAVLPYLFII